MQIKKVSQKYFHSSNYTKKNSKNLIDKYFLSDKLKARVLSSYFWLMQFSLQRGGEMLFFWGQQNYKSHLFQPREVMCIQGERL